MKDAESDLLAAVGAPSARAETYKAIADAIRGFGTYETRVKVGSEFMVAFMLYQHGFRKPDKTGQLFKALSDLRKLLPQAFH